MRYQETAPPPDLAGDVDCFWSLRGAATPGARPERIVPDGRIEVIVNAGDPFVEVDGDGARRRQPAAFVVGQMERPLWIAPSGRVDLAGVRFHPWGARAFLRIPLHELCGQVVALADLDGARRRSLSGPLPSILRRWSAARGDERVRHAARALVASGGRTPIAELARACGLGVRQLERRFDDEVGVGPKRLARLLRFQQVFRAVAERPAPGWAEVALACGYYDQAHLHRDFRRFAAARPSGVERFDELTEIFLRRRR